MVSIMSLGDDLTNAPWKAERPLMSPSIAIITSIALFVLDGLYITWRLRASARARLSRRRRRNIALGWISPR